MNKSVSEKLKEKLPYKLVWNNNIESVFQGAKVTNQSFYRMDMNRFESNDTIFINCNFSGAACDSSRFFLVIFQELLFKMLGLLIAFF